MSSHAPFRNARVNQALHFAVIAHGNQVRKGNLYVPYVFHPIDVAYELICHSGIQEEHLDDAVVTALLHDTVEDTIVTLTDIHEQFGDHIAHAVDALTKNSGLSLRESVSKEEVLLENLARLKNAAYWVQAVKMADRVSNLKVFPNFWSRDKIAEYLDHSIRIARELGASSEGLQAQLMARVGTARTMLSLIQ